MTPPLPAAALSELLGQATSLRDRYVIVERDWYRTKKTLPRLLFRGAGILIIVLSAAIPVLVQSTWFAPQRDNIIAVMGLTVAILTSLTAFLGWDRVWRGRRQTEATLQHLLAIWDMEMLRAQTTVPEADARNHILQATKELLEASHTVTMSEAEQFFDGLKPVGSSSASRGETTSTTKP